MSVRLTVPDVTGNPLEAVNNAVATSSGGAVIVNDGVASDWIADSRLKSLPGIWAEPSFTLHIVPGYGGANFRADLAVRNAADNVDLSYTAGASVYWGEAYTSVIVGPITQCPALTTSMLAFLRVTTATPNRRVVIDSVNFRRWATATDLLAVSLDADTARSAEVSGTGTLVVAQGPQGPRTGSLTYLVDTWLDAQGAANLRKLGPVTITEGPLAGLTYWALGKVKVSADNKALPGRPAKWLVQVDIQEAS